MQHVSAKGTFEYYYCMSCKPSTLKNKIKMLTGTNESLVRMPINNISEIHTCPYLPLLQKHGKCRANQVLLRIAPLITGYSLPHPVTSQKKHILKSFQCCVFGFCNSVN